jgi:serine phosphatase RsbU (regulator of sigma subunit)
MIKFLMIVSLLLILGQGKGISQEIEVVNAQVFYQDKTNPISGAKVLLKSNPQTFGMSDMKGNFTLNVPANSPQQIEVIVLVPQQNQLNLVLENKKEKQSLITPYTAPKSELSEYFKNNKKPQSQNANAQQLDSISEKNQEDKDTVNSTLANIRTLDSLQKTRRIISQKIAENRNNFTLKGYEIELLDLAEKIKAEKNLLINSNQEVKKGINGLLKKLKESKEIKPEERDSLKKYVLALEDYLNQYSEVFKTSQQELRQALEEVKSILFEQEYRIERNRITIISLSAVITGLALLIYIFYIINKRVSKQRSELAYKIDKINRQKEEIERQQAKILIQNQDLEQKSEDLSLAYNQIRDSLVYAQRIQQAFLGNSIKLEEVFHENFVFLKPRDIVSGDFYWLHETEKEKILAVIDCTGHGVPGAFMTILGNNILNLIVKEKQVSDPAKILALLDQELHIALQKSEEQQTSKYGMDLMIISFDKTKKEVSIAGSHSYLYYVKDKQINLIKGGTYLIGSDKSQEQHEFENHTFALEGDETFYLFTDGFQDQFGGEQDSKYLKNRFRDLLLSLSDKPLKEQEKILEKEFMEWKQDENQTDDVLVIGIRP